MRYLFVAFLLLAGCTSFQAAHYSTREVAGDVIDAPFRQTQALYEDVKILYHWVACVVADQCHQEKPTPSHTEVLQ